MNGAVSGAEQRRAGGGEPPRPTFRLLPAVLEQSPAQTEQEPQAAAERLLRSHAAASQTTRTLSGTGAFIYPEVTRFGSRDR